jgi:hypothetical protein
VSAEQGTHFFYITMHQVNALGPYTNSFSGAFTPKPGETRLDLYNAIRADFEASDSKVRGGIVLAFDIQPNQL